MQLQALIIIKKSFSQDGRLSEALYVKALAQIGLNGLSAAESTWREIVKISRPSLEKVHASIAIGDLLFQKDDTDSFSFYHQGYKSLMETDVSKEVKKIEKFQIDYRLLWASHRLKNFSNVLVHGKNLLEVSSLPVSQNDFKGIQQDAVELTGIALHKTKTGSQIRSWLADAALGQHAAGIGLEVMAQQKKGDKPKDIIEMGRFLEKTFPLSRVSPSILSLTANALSQDGPAQEMLELLEQVSTYLPSNSLWRERHGQHSDFVEKWKLRH